jgi:hypothetical protein
MLRNPGLRKSVEQPVLDLNFAAAQIGSNGAPDSRIDFSRGNNAWFVDSDGLVKKSPHNLFLQSEDFSTTWSAIGDVTVATNEIVAPDGTTTADKISSANFEAGGNHIRQSSGTIDAGTYTVSVFVKAGSLDTFKFRIVTFAPSTVDTSSIFDLSTGEWTLINAAHTVSTEAYPNDWFRLSVTFSNPASGAVHPRFGASSGSGFIYLWGAQFSQHTTLPVGNPYIKTEGSAVYAARLDHDPVTNTPKGLLIEEARTNLVTDSEDFSAASWSGSGVTVTGNDVLAPDGTTTGTKLVATSTNAILSDSFTKAASAKTYTATLFAKTGDEQNITLTIDDGNSTNRGRVVFDITDGSVSSTNDDGDFTNTSGSAEDFGNGWYRLRVTTTTNTGTSLRHRFFFTDFGTDTCFVWGAQLEEGSFPTSYIQTTGSTATRNADVAVMGPTTGGTELVTNGTFDTDTTGWVAYPTSDPPTLSVSSGELQILQEDTANFTRAVAAISTVVGRRYRLTVDVTTSNSSRIAVTKANDGSGGVNLIAESIQSAVSTKTIDFTSTQATLYIALQNYASATGNPQTVSFDNVSVRELYPFEQYRPDQGTMVVAFDTQSGGSRGPWWFSRGGATSTGWGLRLQGTTTIDSMVRDSSNFNSLTNLTITPDFDIVAASYEQRASDTFCSVATATDFDDDGHVNDIDVSVDTLDISQCKIGGSDSGIMSGHIKRLQYFPIAMNDETKLKNMCND